VWKRFNCDGIISLVLALIVLGILIPLLSHVREGASRTRCQNNLKQLSLSVLNYESTYRRCPTATTPHAHLPPEKRLSWLVSMLPYLGVNGGSDPIYPSFDPQKAWDDPDNFPVRLRDRKGNTWPMTTSFEFFCCPADVSHAQRLKDFQTTYVGLTGLGENAAALPLDDPRVGFFGYERQLRERDITDGLSTSFMIAETGKDNGYWFQGGYPTARGLIPDQPPVVGAHGPFSSQHRSSGGANFAFADGSVRFITEGVSPKVLEAAVTIRGNEPIAAFGEE
jgi:prepilin-type processing-associated H-X9-DG protein